MDIELSESSNAGLAGWPVELEAVGGVLVELDDYAPFTVVFLNLFLLALSLREQAQDGEIMIYKYGHADAAMTVD